MYFKFDKQKNEKLIEERGIGFPDIIKSLYENGISFDFKHPNHKKYPNQRIMIVEYNNYPYAIPYIIENDYIFLKTIYPSRKFKK